jgi:KDO2-lipid IV(A) lauroyltransferase
VTRAFRHRLEDAAVGAVSFLARTLPRPLVVTVGEAIGLSFYWLDRPHRRLTIENLSRAFPHRDTKDIRRTAREVYAHFGRLLIEILRFASLSVEEIRATCELEGYERALEASRAAGGALYFTGHFGFWELQAVAQGALFEPITVVARALDNPYLHARLERFRTATGNQVIYRRGGLRRILRALGENRGVAVLIDQHIQGTDAVMVDFFGRPAATTTAVAALALRTRVPVIPVFALPLPGGRYRMIAEHPVELPEGDGPDAVRELTQRCTDVLEMYVRRYPELWLWMHRRWRDDDHAQVPGMFPAAGHDSAHEGERFEDDGPVGDAPSGDGPARGSE